MYSSHHRDLSIFNYVMIGALIIGTEIFGVVATLYLGLGLMGAVLMVSLIAAAIGHAGLAGRAARRRQPPGDRDVPREWVGPVG